MCSLNLPLWLTIGLHSKQTFHSPFDTTQQTKALVVYTVVSALGLVKGAESGAARQQASRVAQKAYKGLYAQNHSVSLTVKLFISTTNLKIAKLQGWSTKARTILTWFREGLEQDSPAPGRMYNSSKEGQCIESISTWSPWLPLWFHFLPFSSFLHAVLCPHQTAPTPGPVNLHSALWGTLFPLIHSSLLTSFLSLLKCQLLREASLIEDTTL